MTNERRDGLSLFLLGALAFVLLGLVLQRVAPAPLVDFRVVYYPARCLVQHGDPYNQGDVLRAYKPDSAHHPPDSERVRAIVLNYLYLPTAFAITVPFALMPWTVSQFLWMATTISGFIFAAFLIWKAGATRAPILCGALVGFLLANSELLVITGNSAGIAISLCIIGAVCFITNRFPTLGVMCLGISLAIKPHDTGLVWLYFFLAGGLHRKRAVHTLIVMLALSLPVLFWVSLVAPHWMQELQTNLSSFAMHGNINDPGVASTGAHGLDMLISLQTIISFFWDEPEIYNYVSYFVCAPLLLIWMYLTLRSRASAPKAWFALASISALTMLPVYHRQIDSRLLLLTIPACAMLWVERGATRWFAIIVNSLAFILTGDIPWALFIALLDRLHLSSEGKMGQLVTVAQVAPIPLTLLVVAVFYLLVYARHCCIAESPSLIA